MPTFYHSGSLGDQIYSLPTVMQLGGGMFVSGMPWAAHQSILPLLKLQTCIKHVRHVSEGGLPAGFVDLSVFRNHPLFTRMYIPELHAAMQNVKIDTSKAWLTLNVAPQQWMLFDTYAVVSVTSRYRDRFFSWDKEVRYLHSQTGCVYFVGHYLEYKDFISSLGYRAACIPKFMNTKDMLEAAHVIKHAKLFSSNQGGNLAIRQALRLPWRFEQSPNTRDTEDQSDLETKLNPVTRRFHLATVCIKRMLFDNQYTRHQI